MLNSAVIKQLQTKILDMLGRGAPVERNDFGFSQADWPVANALKDRGVLNAPNVSVNDALLMLKVLERYQKRQVPNFQELKQQLESEISTLSGPTHEANTIVVHANAPRYFDKIQIEIPFFITRKNKEEIKKIIEKDPREFLFLRDRASHLIYWVHPDYLEQILDVFKKEGKKVHLEGGTPKTTSQPSGETITILRTLKNNYGNKLEIKIYKKGLYKAMKDAGLAPKGVSYDLDNHSFLINIDDMELFNRVKEFLKSQGINTTPLDDFQAKHKPEEQQDTDTSSPNQIAFQDMQGDKIKVKINYGSLDQKEKDFLKESIQYIFPEYRFFARPDESRRDGFYYEISGDFKQFSKFGQILSKYGYEVEPLRQILRQKLAEGRIQKIPHEGRFDDNQQFIDSIQSKFPQSNVELYDAQNFGIAFLYGRDHAILGDETGLGKTVQLVSAAELKMKDTGKPTLILTKKAVQDQIAKEIVNMVGQGEASQISTDPENPKKWTILYYENFTPGGHGGRNEKITQYVQKLRDFGFGVVIFDELHKVKHSKSSTNQNIAEVVSKIPTRWGASATVSSNKPFDIKGQLTMIGHPLGRLRDGKFKSDFAGMKPTGYGGAYEESENPEDAIVAAERLNRWLNLTGVYVRRSKKDIRDMPDITVKDKDTNVDQEQFQNLYSRKIAEYQQRSGGKKVLAVSKLIAARETLARLKVPETTRTVISIVKNGEGKESAASKVVVFTNFVESGSLLFQSINEELKKINLNYRAITYTSDTSKKELKGAKEVFTNDDNVKVLIMSMRMGGTGIDFPNASQNMVINDFDWTPESAEQSEGRIYRINTNHNVKIQYIVANGVDKSIFENVKRKRELATIIQQYREEYHTTGSQKALDAIVKAQKELIGIDNEIVAQIAKEAPGAEKGLGESVSFADFIEMFEYLIN